MKRIKEKVIRWLLAALTDQEDSINLEQAWEHQMYEMVMKLDHRVTELEVARKYPSVSSTKGPPPGMENIRPGYKTRSSRRLEAQKILNDKMAKEAPDVATSKT